MKAQWCSCLVVVVVENVSVCVNFDNTFKLCIDDEVYCVGKGLSEMKFYAKVALFYELKMISRTTIRGHIKCKQGVSLVIIASSHLVSLILGKCPNSGEKTLKASYEILTASFLKLEKKRFPRYLLSIHVNTDLGYDV